MFSINDKIIECVVNVSEGRDQHVIQEIKHSISSVEDIKLLHIDQGEDVNRTVFTFAGYPLAVMQAAYLLIQKATELIDMQKHLGVHSRIGAVDVCPLVPLYNMSIGDTLPYATKLAEMVGEELQIPVYLYEHSASDLHRRNLANIRKGQYEGLVEKIKQRDWKPDYGPALFNPKIGATVIGVRDILIAYNISLKTDQESIATEIATEIARKIRSSGYQQEPGLFRGLKAIGWMMQKYQHAQVSMNITNREKAPVHLVFEKVKELAHQLGVEVIGSELIGLIPKKDILLAGNYYISSQSENELIQSAINHLGLDQVIAFDPKQRILEEVLFTNS